VGELNKPLGGLMRSVAIFQILILMPAVAFASTSSEVFQPTSSRALTIAKRVAENENQGDLPSRAVWLSQRVVKNLKTLAYSEKPTPQKSKKRSQNSIKN
jgi:hypothetical protein